MTKFNIPDPPKDISREAFAGMAIVFVGILKFLQVSQPNSPIASTAFAQLRRLHKLDREIHILKEVDSQEAKILVDYLETLFDDPKLDLLFSKPKGKSIH